MKTKVRLALALAFGFGAVLGAGSAPLRAQGLYVLGGLGIKTVYDQDFNDYYQDPNIYYGSQGLGEADVSLGYRFPGIMALEGTVGLDSGRSASDSTYLGYSSLQIQPVTTLSLGPVFCWDRASWWFAQTGETQFGLRAMYSMLNGSESVAGYGAQNFSGSTFGFGLFLRLLNIWNSTGFNLGLEAGYDFDTFNTLTIGSASGGFSGFSGTSLTNYVGSNAYFDNSGAYLRIIFGWSQPSRRYRRPHVRRTRYWRHRVAPYYPDNNNYNYPEDGDEYPYTGNGGNGGGADGDGDGN